MFLDDIVGPMSIKEATKKLSGADKFRKHISDIEKKYEPSEKHYNRLKTDPAYREQEFQKWQQEVHGKPVKEDDWHGGADDWSSDNNQLGGRDPFSTPSNNQYHEDTQLNEYPIQGASPDDSQSPVHGGMEEHIVKVKGGYELKSKHGNKNLGKYPTRAGAEKRERQVQYFKHAGESVEEAQTDYQKRRQRERDVDAGKPVARQPKNPQTDYAKKRAQDKKDALFGEAEADPNAPYTPSPAKPFRNPPGFNKQGTGVGNKLAQQTRAEVAKEKQSGVAEDADQVKKVFKDKSGKPVGEIGIDPESSPGNGEWYVHHYATGYSVVGFDSAAEAKRELMYVHKHPDAVEGHPSTKEQGVAEEKKRALYHKTQDAPTKQAIDKAYRANPGAKNDTEALASLLSREIDSIEQEKELNQDQDQRIRDLDTVVSKIGGQKPSNIATPTTPGAAKSMPMPTAKATAAPTAPASNVIPMPTPKTPAPTAARTPVTPASTGLPSAAMPAAGVQQPAQEPKTATGTATSPAIGQMAKQLSQPQGRVIKGKNQPSVDATSTSNNVTQLPTSPESLKRLQQLGSLGVPTSTATPSPAEPKDDATPANNEPFRLVAEAVSAAELEQISTYNNQTFTQSYAHSQPAKLYYGDGQWEDLTAEEIDRMVSAIATDYTPQTRPQVWQGLFTDHNYFKEFKKQHLSQQPLPFNEGDVVPFTNNQQTLQAYNDAMQIIKAVADTRVPDARVNTMRQNFSSKYQQRYQIAQAPDRTYYLLDKQTNQRQRLPDPRTFAIENTNYWVKLQNERSKKLNSLVNELKESIK